jgi:hypothetical protein
MLHQYEINLIHKMRALVKQAPRPSIEYALIFDGWLFYTSGYSLLWVYDPTRFIGRGACEILLLTPDTTPEAFQENEAWQDLTDPDRLALCTNYLPTGIDAPEVGPLEAYADAQRFVEDTGTQCWLDADWVFPLLMDFCAITETVSVHPGPHPRYLKRQRGVWFRKRQTEFFGVLPVVRKSKP